jgi:fibronectin type III domain protein
LTNKLGVLGAWIAIASLLSGCIDPGPSSAPAPHSLSSGSRTATVSWDAPTSNTNGTPLTDLTGYRIYYGSSPGELVETIRIGSIGMQTYVIDDLEPGTWYFAVVAVAANGAESSLSDIAVKTIT